MIPIKPIIDYLTPLLTYYRGRPLQKPTVYLRMTPRCNLKCTICDEWQYETHADRHIKENILSCDEYKKIIDNLVDFKVERLQFGGGEALVRKDTTDLILYAKDRGLSTRILTNGVLLANKNIAAKLAEGIDEVWLSIDSPDPNVHDQIRGVKGTFDRVMQGIDNLNLIRSGKNNRHFKICVATHFSPHNIFDPQDLIDLLHSKNIDFMLCTPTYDGNYGKTNFSSKIKTHEDRTRLINMIRSVRKVIYNEKMPIQTNPLSLDIAEQYYINEKTVAKFKCLIGGYDLGFIETNGDIYPCTAYPVSMGNIKSFNYDFKELWHGVQARQIRKQIKQLACGGCFHLQTQKNHLYNIKTLSSHIFELPQIFRHLVRTHNISNPSHYNK